MNKFSTYDPEQPPLHLRDRDHVANILNHVGHEESTDPEGGMETREHVAERAEEALHRQERNVHLQRM